MQTQPRPLRPRRDERPASDLCSFLFPPWLARVFSSLSVPVDRPALIEAVHIPLFLLQPKTENHRASRAGKVDDKASSREGIVGFCDKHRRVCVCAASS